MFDNLIHAKEKIRKKTFIAKSVSPKDRPPPSRRVPRRETCGANVHFGGIFTFWATIDEESLLFPAKSGQKVKIRALPSPIDKGRNRGYPHG